MVAPGTGEARRGESAVLFADVHGYSVHMARDEAAAFGRVLAARELCRRLIPDYGGRLVQTVGDGIFAVFPAAERAVRFALAFQRDMAAGAIWHDVELRPLRWRIGIHWGEIVFAGEEVYGYNINIAERLQRLAAPGGVCVSDAVRRLLGDAPELACRPLGWKRLHNIDGALLAHELAQLAAPGGDGGGPAPARRALGAAAATAAAADDGEASLAVLPLEPLSGEPVDRHLANGVSADLIHNLTRFRELLVIARHSAFRFRKERDDRATGRRLGVRYLLKGTLQRQDRRLRIACQLLEAETGACLWSDRFDGGLDDIFLFQDEATSTIAGRLAIQVAAAERRRRGRDGAAAAAPAALSAYGLVLRGEELSLELRRDSVMHARRLFEQASALDPEYGRSYAALSRTFNYEWRYAWSPRPERSLDRALALAQAAVDRDPLDARGYAELGYTHLYRKTLDGSLTAFEQALELNPNDADIVAEASIAVSCAGRPEDALGRLQRALRLNPFAPDSYHWYMGEIFFDLARYEDAITALERMRDRSEAQRLLSASYALLGDLERAGQHAKEVVRVHPQFSLEAWRSITPDSKRDSVQRFVAGLRLAGLR